jgi:hypothetical protein
MSMIQSIMSSCPRGPSPGSDICSDILQEEGRLTEVHAERRRTQVYTHSQSRVNTFDFPPFNVDSWVPSSAPRAIPLSGEARQDRYGEAEVHDSYRSRIAHTDRRGITGKRSKRLALESRLLESVERWEQAYATTVFRDGKICQI